MPQLLLELFSEEIPARMQAQAAKDLERLAREKLAAEGLLPEALTAFAGPRRLTLVAEGLAAAQAERHEERKGPRVGSPDQAIDGFLRSTGLTRDQLTERDGLYYAHIHKAGRPTAEIIAEMVDAIVRNFPWPKSMVSGVSKLRWVRPLQRILCVFDGEVVPFTIDGHVSGDLAEGHRFMGTGQAFHVKDFDSYRDGLARNFVVLDPQDRRDRILADARSLCFARNLALVEDQGLLDEVAGLAEWPTPVLGNMDREFLDLPPEVIRTSMRVHQRFFAVRDLDTGVLAPHFITVANIDATDGGTTIAIGNARVLSARLSDARFFWDEDLKRSVEERLTELNGVTFHARLGTMRERVARIESLSVLLAPKIGVGEEIARRAALLAKSDLTSGMVREFPELQGVMGRYYYRAWSGLGLVSASGVSGEAKLPLSMADSQAAQEAIMVADAIRDHYKPLGPNDEVPIAPVSAVVALADKLDTLVGFFAIDEKPTGSRDPYALRRAALGVIRILLETRTRLPLKTVIEFAQRRLLDLPETVIDAVQTAQIDSEDTGAPFGRQLKGISESAVDELDRRLVMLGFDTAERESIMDAGSPWAIELVLYWNEARRNYVGDRVVPPRDLANPGLWPDKVNSVDSDVSDRIAPARDALLAFFADRLKVLLRDQGQRHDLVDAVFALGDDDIVRIVEKVTALGEFLGTEDGVNLLAGYKRAVNILKGEERKGSLPTGEPVVSTGIAAAESELFFRLSAIEPELERALSQEDYAAAMTALAALRAPVDAFFDKVLVNSDVPAERDNRLRLLAKVRDAMGRVADFGQVTG